MSEIELYDTTLRDGAQFEGISLSVEDKLAITRRLDQLGVHYVEGGWPGSNPKDADYFRRVGETELANAAIAAFGSTRYPGLAVQDDSNIRALLECGASVATLVGKSWDLHVTRVLETSLEENLAMISDSVAYLKANGRRVFFDAEHFFDGFKANAAYALQTVRAAAGAGAECVILCDTNGGTLPEEIGETVAAVGRETGREARDTHPQRCRHGGRRSTGGGTSRRHPYPGHHQRLWRALRQREPGLHHCQSEAEAGR